MSKTLSICTSLSVCLLFVSLCAYVLSDRHPVSDMKKVIGFRVLTEKAKLVLCVCMYFSASLSVRGLRSKNLLRKIQYDQ